MPADEYANLPGLAFQDDDIDKMIQNGFRYAFLSGKKTGRYVDNLKQTWNELHPRPGRGNRAS